MTISVPNVQETKSSFDNLYGVTLHIFNNETYY
jgi:hypothetical protein